MSKGRRVEIPLSKLVVNPENYRFDPVQDEEKALATMMESLGSEVANLARDIFESGLNPLRNILVVSEGSKFIVLDGNRRTTALKLLNDPELIESNYPLKQVFKSLKVQGYVPPQSIEAIVFDPTDIEEAEKWILVEHSGKHKGIGTVSWGSKEKARFSSRHNNTVADKALQLTDFLEVKKIDTKGVDLTNLNRILADPYSRKRMGVEFVKGTLLIKDEAASLPNVLRVISKLKTKSFKVRDIYSKKDRIIWIDKVIPIDSAKSSSKGMKGKSNSKIPQKRFPGLIDPSESAPEGLSDKIIDLHDELIKITVSKNPHATAALLRIYMELLSKDYLITCLGYQQRGEKLVDGNGTGDFSELIAKLTAIQSHSKTPKDIKGSLTILITRDFITSRLNQVMHSYIFIATEHDLRSIWTNLKPVMDYIMIEISKAKQR